MEDNTAKTVTETDKKAGKKAGKKASKKESENKVTGFFKGVKREFRKIIFPDRKTVAKQTVAVVCMSVFIGALIAVLDLVMKFGLSFIL